MRQVPLYSRALSTGLLFPKTRRIVFLNNQPATLSGWAVLKVG
jgi:CRISPR-associated protein Csm5